MVATRGWLGLVATSGEARLAVAQRKERTRKRKREKEKKRKREMGE